ncbi:MAG TPA: hypothetical protein VFF81_14110 [Noviherbaspirillum sp.]|nr:hypothetical protein [Noviherbaspirillum sp.]
MRLRQIGIPLLLFLGSAPAIAGAGGFWSDGLNAVRTYQMPGFAMERSDQRRGPSVDRGSDRRHERRSGGSESSGDGPQGNPGHQQDNANRQSRLSPEQRRALRRQIDEAGQDIYTPKR